MGEDGSSCYCCCYWLCDWSHQLAFVREHSGVVFACADLYHPFLCKPRDLPRRVDIVLVAVAQPTVVPCAP